MEDLGKLIVAKGFKKLPKVQLITKSGHTDCKGLKFLSPAKKERIFLMHFQQLVFSSDTYKGSNSAKGIFGYKKTMVKMMEQIYSANNVTNILLVILNFNCSVLVSLFPEPID